jgi:diguanylate cyclase (GGDEF)-like protein
MKAGTWRAVAARFAIYALVILVPVAALGVVLARTFAQETDRDALAEGVANARLIADSAIVSQLDGNLANGLSETARRNLVKTTRPLLEHGSLLRLRLRGPQGEIVFDAAHPYAAVRRVDIEDDVAEALRGDVVAMRTRLDSDLDDGGHRNGPQTIEVYFPLLSHARIDDGTIGVLEMYVPYAPIVAERNASLHRMYVVLLCGLALLWVMLAAILWSVTGRLRRESSRNEHLALHDVLTGLPNRALFRDRAASAVAAARRDGGDVTIAVVDLDRFKEVNDTLGHHNGDSLLTHIAARMQCALRPGDTVARLGGDEFGLVLRHLDARDAPAVLRRIQSAVGEELELDGVPVSAEATIGYAIWPDDGDDAETLLQHADLAMYAAKESRAGVVAYSNDIDHFDAARIGLVSELRRAIAAEELVLHYQPKIDLARARADTVEALVRWQHPTRGLLPPAEFLPVAESTGLIGPLTQWVVRDALAQLVAWGDELDHLEVSVNVSARSLRDDRFADWVLGELGAFGVEPRRLVLEVTETSFIADTQRAAALLQRLVEGGVRVSIDDFGQGYTSLSLLSHLPVSELKIDRGFVAAMQASREDHAIVASVIELGHQLGLTVVAEGVETETVLAELRALGCDVAQGYLFASALPADDARRWLLAQAHETLASRDRVA